MHVCGWINWWSERCTCCFTYLSKISNCLDDFFYLLIPFCIFDMVVPYITASQCWKIDDRWNLLVLQEGSLVYVIRVCLPKTTVAKGTKKREVPCIEGNSSWRSTSGKTARCQTNETFYRVCGYDLRTWTWLLHSGVWLLLIICNTHHRQRHRRSHLTTGEERLLTLSSLTHLTCEKYYSIKLKLLYQWYQSYQQPYQIYK